MSTSPNLPGQDLLFRFAEARVRSVSVPTAIVVVMNRYLLPTRSLSRVGTDRNHTDRGADGSVADVLARSGTQIFFCHRGSLLVSREGLHMFSLADLKPHWDKLTGTRVYIGRSGAADLVALLLDDAGRSTADSAVLDDSAASADDFLLAPAAGAAMDDPTWVDLRALAAELSDADIDAATTAVALDNWHRTHTHSPRTGDPTVPSAGGWVRVDPAAGTEHFPRTDPAVITAVLHTDDSGTERILLGNNALWPEGRYSLLAGFVEPGETLEQAVRREVQEESNIDCDTIRYLGSQPWPFPCSLMLGFAACARSATITADGCEIADVKWFSRDDIASATADGSLSLPGEVSIAGQIISAWMNGEQLL